MNTPRAPQPDSVETLAAIGPIARSSVVDAVADRLRGEILSGRLAAGTRLPSERELSLALGINRLTLRASLARLEALGFIATRHGAGTLVSDWKERSGLDALPALISALRPTDPTWTDLLVSILEMRRILVSEAVGLAAIRHVAGDIDKLREIAREQVTRVEDPIAFARGELAFQRAVARAARNIGLELVLNTFARFPDEQPALVATLYDRTRESVLFYDYIIALIVARDGAQARDQLRKAFERIDEDIIERHFPRPPVIAESAASPVATRNSEPVEARTKADMRVAKASKKGKKR